MAGAWIIAPQNSDYTQNSETIPFPVFVPYTHKSRRATNGKNSQNAVEILESHAVQRCYAKNTWNFTQKACSPIAEPASFFILCAMTSAAIAVCVRKSTHKWTLRCALSQNVYIIYLKY